MTGTTVIEQDGGHVAVAVLSDGTLSTPMGAPVRDTREEADRDRSRIVLDESGPRFTG